MLIEGKEVINNDGVHSVKTEDTTIDLTKGEHELVIKYFEGPRTSIALQLFWETPSNRSKRIIPSSALKYPN